MQMIQDGRSKARFGVIGTSNVETDRRSKPEVQGKESDLGLPKRTKQ